MKMQLKKILRNKQIKKIQMMAKEITILYYKAVKQIEMLHESYIKGHPSNQCHRAMVVFLSRPKVRVHIERPVTKSLEAPNWHWLISSPMGAQNWNF